MARETCIIRNYLPYFTQIISSGLDLKQLAGLLRSLIEELQKSEGETVVISNSSAYKAVFQVYIMDELADCLRPLLVQKLIEAISLKTDWGLFLSFYELGCEEFYKDCLFEVMRSYIKQYCNQHKSYKQEFLQNCLENFERMIKVWILSIIPSSFSAEIDEILSIYEKTCYKSVGKLIIDNMFDIILEYPESQPVLKDLSTCIQKVKLQKYLQNQVKESLKRRVVNPSKSTEGILMVYINLTKAMRSLFPTIEMLEYVSEPIKAELRKRPDTFKCIIKSISEDEELYSLLDTKQKRIKEQEDFSSDEDEKAASEWNPIPRRAVKSVINSLNKKSDLVSMLINIYGSQEQFMEEYRVFLSKKLVHNSSFDISSEIKDLEMLKKRFGESNVHKCEVMLQDVHNSKRINSFIHEARDPSLFLTLDKLHCLIISGYFWPVDENEHKFKLPEKLEKTYAEFLKRYELIRASRKLKYHEALGSVTLTLEFQNGSKTWENVQPLQAAIICLFDQSEGFKSSEELASALGISSRQLRKEISFWESRGVIKRMKQEDEYYYKAVNELY